VKEGRNWGDGRKERRKGGEIRKEGRQEGRKEGRKDSMEGRNHTSELDGGEEVDGEARIAGVVAGKDLTGRKEGRGEGGREG
jgi:hypothetical protein